MDLEREADTTEALMPSNTLNDQLSLRERNPLSVVASKPIVAVQTLLIYDTRLRLSRQGDIIQLEPF
jgi:hypothetical protein